MSYFRFPASWVRIALAAAVTAFGPIDWEVQVRYRNLAPHMIGAVYFAHPGVIWIDKRPRAAWTRPMALCTVAHEYGHLAGRRHSHNPRSLMYYAYRRTTCQRWLRTHGAYDSWLTEPRDLRNLLRPSVDMPK